MLIIMRGWSGSGKTFLANQLAGRFRSQHRGCTIMSTDDFWLYQKGEYPFRCGNTLVDPSQCEYRFNPTMLAEAHVWNITRAKDWFHIEKDNSSVLIIDNTNILCEHYYPYRDMAGDTRHQVFQSEPECIDSILSDFESPNDERKLKSLQALVTHWKRNTHKVPLSTIIGMVERFEPSGLTYLRQ